MPKTLRRCVLAGTSRRLGYCHLCPGRHRRSLWTSSSHCWRHNMQVKLFSSNTTFISSFLCFPWCVCGWRLVKHLVWRTAVDNPTSALDSTNCSVGWLCRRPCTSLIHCSVAIAEIAFPLLPFQQTRVQYLSVASNSYFCLNMVPKPRKHSH